MWRLNFELKDGQLMCHAVPKYVKEISLYGWNRSDDVSVLLAMRTYAPYGGSTLVKRLLITVFVVCKYQRTRF